MLRNYSLVSFLILVLCSCCQTQDKKTDITYPRIVGETKFDAAVDEPSFKPCNEERVHQYYNFGNGFQYTGEKSEIIRIFKERFKSQEKKGESGYITIRFIVNCKRQTGWFRIQEMDNEYNPKKFDKGIVDGLLKITKGLDGWITGELEKVQYDYYQYLTFKMENGLLIDIMP